MISPSSPEPLCDIEAQWRALCNPRHPKQALWIARGTPWPERPFNFKCRVPAYAAFPEGVLLSQHVDDIAMLRCSPDDRTIADILGYLEPKWAAGVNAVVIRALDDDGCVVTEMAVSPKRMGEAYAIVKQHGTPELTTINAALERRRILCASEMA